TINPAARRILEIDDDKDVVGSDHHELLRTDENPDLASAVAAVLATGTPQELYEKKVCTHRDLNVNLNLKGIALHDSRDKQLRMVLVIEDITEKQRAKSALSRLVSSQVADRVMSQESLQLGGIRTKVTVLMSDIRDFT